MTYKYVHDADSRVLYRFPALPNIIEQKQRGVRIRWHVQMDILITHAQNRLVKNKLQHPTLESPQQDFARHYEREQVVSFFYRRHTPKAPIYRKLNTSKYSTSMASSRGISGNRLTPQQRTHRALKLTRRIWTPPPTPATDRSVKCTKG